MITNFFSTREIDTNAHCLDERVESNLERWQGNSELFVTSDPVSLVLHAYGSHLKLNIKSRISFLLRDDLRVYIIVIDAITPLFRVYKTKNIKIWRNNLHKLDKSNNVRFHFK